MFDLSERTAGVSVGLGIAAVFLFATIWGGFYTIEQGNRGVVLRFGKLNDVVDPGLHFKLPWIDSVDQRTKFPSPAPPPLQKLFKGGLSEVYR